MGHVSSQQQVEVVMKAYPLLWGQSRHQKSGSLLREPSGAGTCSKRNMSLYSQISGSPRATTPRHFTAETLLMPPDTTRYKWPYPMTFHPIDKPKDQKFYAS